MEATKRKIRKPVIGIETITMTCPCGGACESRREGSATHMIQDFDTTATCSDCGEVYQVPAGVFIKRLRG